MGNVEEVGFRVHLFYRPLDEMQLQQPFVGFGCLLSVVSKADQLKTAFSSEQFRGDRPEKSEHGKAPIQCLSAPVETPSSLRPAHMHGCQTVVRRQGPLLKGSDRSIPSSTATTGEQPPIEVRFHGLSC